MPLFVDLNGGGGGGGRSSFMFAMSRDEQLFYKAYNDYGDLDGDNVPDTSYNHSFEYYGLFDPQKCYSYDDTNERFVPEGFSSRNPQGLYTYECDTLGRFWAGNFLNWVTTVRLEIVQKVLYGGRRVVDESGGDTVLEGAYLMPDSHSYTKYISDSDLIEQVTPVRWAEIGIPEEDQELTICRTSMAIANPNHPNSPHIFSQNFELPPMFKVVYGDFRLWDLQGTSQCSLGRSSFDPDTHGIPSFTPDSNEAPLPFRFIGGDGVPNGTDVSWSWSDYSDMYLAHRVQVCVPAHINADNRESCKQYPDGNFKPIGIVQRYGETNLADYGLATTTYRNSHRGGLVRRRLGPFTDEVDLADGTFITYNFSNVPDEGLFIQMLNNLYLGMATSRVRSRQGNTSVDASPNFRWRRVTALQVQQCENTFLDPELDTNCVAWGNPFTEMLQETVRYMTGSSSPRFRTYLSGYKSAFYFVDELKLYAKNIDWTENSDLIASNECSPINLLAINASLISLDGDNLDSGGAVSLANMRTYTDSIGTAEGISGALILADANGSDSGFTDDLCTLQTFTNLSSVRGICPDAAGYRGTYLSAGLAYYAHTQDLRSNIEGEQVLNHLFVELRPNVPEIVVPLDSLGGAFVGRRTIIQGAYANHRAESNPLATWGSGRLTKFYPVEVPRNYTTNDGRDVYGGRYLVGWEDSVSGTDFDEDIWGFIDFILDPAAQTLEVGTNVLGTSASTGQHLFGFTILGTNQDGFHVYSGHMAFAARFRIQQNNVPAFQYDDPVGTAIPACGRRRSHTDPANPPATILVDLRRPNGTDADNTTLGCIGERGRVSHLFRPSSTPIAALQSPLFYAAKYGGFQDSNDNELPDLREEWDALDLDGNSVPDGIPDNYFPVSDPSRLSSSLERAFIQGGVGQNTASGTAAALVANEREGQGAVFQALFEPTREDENGNEVTWIGTLHALFIDAAGLLREDSNENNILDSYDMDRVVELFYNENLGETEALLYTSSDADTFMSSGSETLALADLKVLWNAREQLSALTNVDERSGGYASPAGQGRYIFTWKDIDQDGRVNSSGEVVPFTAARFTGADANFLDVPEAEVPELVSYLRGESPVGMRNRNMDYEGRRRYRNIAAGRYRQLIAGGHHPAVGGL